MSRPSDYTPELADYICEQVMDGKSLRGICAADDMPNRSTVFRWLTEHQDFATKYARARVVQAEYLLDEMVEIEDATINEQLDPAAARAVLGSKQWRAAKLAPKKYGDRLDLGNADDEAFKVSVIERRIVKAGH